MAGLTVGVMLVPQGMAYALLAGVPPIYGLYGALIPIIIYAIFGTSRHLSIGPVAISASLILSGISSIEGVETMTPQYIQLVILAGFLIGIGQLLMGVLRLGFLVNFLSHPVLAGFTSAAAIIIIISQLKFLFGIQVGRFEYTHETLEYILLNLDKTNIPTFLVCIIAILILVLVNKLNSNYPSALIVVILGIVTSYLLNLSGANVSIVGAAPEGLPSFDVLHFDLKTVKLLMPTVFTVSIIGVVESMSISKALEAKHRDYIVDANQELLALGLSKMFGAFFQALPTSGSFSRSAVNSNTGGKTNISSIFSALLVALTLLFLMPFFYYLPNAVLAAIIFVAIVGLIDIEEAKLLWKIHRQDFFLMLTTFFLTLFLGIETGILIGVILSVSLIVYRTTKPHIAILGNIKGTPAYRNVERFPKAEETEGVLIIRMDASLYFGNSDFFKSTIRRLVREREGSLKMLLLDASSFHEIDSSGLHAITEMVEELQQKNIEFYLSGAIGPVRDLLTEAGFNDLIGKRRQFMYIDDAMRYYNDKEGEV